LIPKNLLIFQDGGKVEMAPITEIKRTESEEEVSTFLAQLQYAIETGLPRITLQKDRQVDKNRDKRHTNRYTIATLFPDEDVVDVMKRELSQLSVEEYQETVKDVRFPERGEMRVFGRKYCGKDVYIKIRVHLFDINQAFGSNHIFIMSFHFATGGFEECDFPYKRG